MLFNYMFGRALGKNNNKNLLTLGVFLNLASIAYYKYAGFLVLNLNTATGNDWDIYPSHFKMQGKTFESCH